MRHQESSGSIHELCVSGQKGFLSSTGDQDKISQQKKKNAREGLKHERMKLNQSLMKNYKSSTNEGSRSVNTFSKIKNIWNIGSSNSSPDRSLLSTGGKKNLVESKNNARITDQND